MKLLTVDDEDDARLLLAEILRYRGAIVIPVASAREVLEFLSTNTVDALISDIGMPDRDGYSLIRAIRETEIGTARHLPAIAMTAYAYEADRRRALEAGFDRHMSKTLRHRRASGRADDARRCAVRRPRSIMSASKPVAPPLVAAAQVFDSKRSPSWKS